MRLVATPARLTRGPAASRRNGWRVHGDSGAAGSAARMAVERVRRRERWGGGGNDGSGADNGAGVDASRVGRSHRGLTTDGVSGTVSDVTQTVSTLGSSGPLQDIVNTSSLLDGLGVNNLDNVLGGSLGGDGLGGNGLDGVLGATNGITLVSNLGIPLPI